jgi:hypothetical protein
LASSPDIALHEVAAVFQSAGGHIRTPPWVLLAIEGAVDHVLDLTDDGVLRRLRTSVAELTGDWRFGQAKHEKRKGLLPPTQVLGEAAYQSGRIAGLLYHAAKKVGKGYGLVVFTERLASLNAGRLNLYDPHGLLQQALP